MAAALTTNQLHFAVNPIITLQFICISSHISHSFYQQQLIITPISCDMSKQIFSFSLFFVRFQDKDGAN